MTPAPSQQTILAGLRSFLLYVLPPGVEVILGQINRVPEPQGSEFVVMTPWNDIRLATTLDGEADVRFVGSIAGAVLTVASVNFGVITAGALLFGVGVLPGTVVGAQLTGAAGSVGTYTVAPSQTLASGTVLSCGAMTLMQELQMDIRLDFHSGGNNGADMARTFTTVFRDPAGTGFFDALGTGISPLYADEARQTPCIDAEQQVDWTWTVDAMLQANIVVSVPQQYADSLDVILKDVIPGGGIATP